MTWRLVEQIFYNYRHTIDTYWVGGVETKSSQGPPYPPYLSTPHMVIQKWEGYRNCRSHPQKRGVWGLAWGTHTRRGAPITSGFENQQDWHLGEQKGYRKPRFLSESQHRGSSLKSTSVTHEGDTLTNFRVYFGGTGYLLELSPEWEVLVNTIFSPFFTLLPPSWSDAGRHHFWHSPLTLLTLFTPPWCFPEDSSKLAPLQVAPPLPHPVGDLSWHQHTAACLQ